MSVITRLQCTKQHAIVSIQLNIVMGPTHSEKFIRDNVIALFSLLSDVIVTLVFVVREFILMLILCNKLNSFTDLIQLSEHCECCLFDQRIHLSIDVGEQTNDYQEIAAKDKLSDLQLRVRQLLDQAEQISKEQNYQRVSTLHLWTVFAIFLLFKEMVFIPP